MFLNHSIDRSWKIGLEHTENHREYQIFLTGHQYTSSE